MIVFNTRKIVSLVAAGCILVTLLACANSGNYTQVPVSPSNERTGGIRESAGESVLQADDSISGEHDSTSSVLTEPDDADDLEHFQQEQVQEPEQVPDHLTLELAEQVAHLIGQNTLDEWGAGDDGLLVWPYYYELGHDYFSFEVRHVASSLHSTMMFLLRVEVITGDIYMNHIFPDEWVYIGNAMSFLD